VIDLGLDSRLLIGLAVALASSFLISVFPILQKDRYLFVLCAMSAALWYGPAFGGFVVVSAAAYVIACGVGRQSDPARRWTWACAGLFLIAGIFTLGRVFEWGSPLPVQGSVSIVLYSLEMWAVLRLLTLVWEVGSGTLATPSLIRYCIWICLPFTLGGPLLRFSQMPEAACVDKKLWTSSEWWFEAAGALSKVMVGVGLTAWHQIILSRWPEADLWEKAIVTFLTGPIGYYLIAGGYFHLMEVWGRPAGFKLLPSFDSPIGRENIAAFWTNWNMTATFMFRDYLFYNRWGYQTYNIYFNTLLLFTLVGLWHEANAYWILWGFLHGLLFCSFLFWRKHRTRLGTIPLSGTRAARLTAGALTYIAVCLCWYLPSKILQKLEGVLW
jgi:D-alanyl-lipoteichoic acid acyltransferase DltB (MBOAT superfamily)